MITADERRAALGLPPRAGTATGSGVDVRFDPAPRPALRDVRLDVRGDDAVAVVGGLSFEFSRGEDGVWRGGGAETAGRGHRVDERSVTAARELAVEALSADLARRAGRATIPTDVIRCGECERLLTSALLPDKGAPDAVECGVEHVAVYADGAVVFDGAGGSWWRSRTDAGG